MDTELEKLLEEALIEYEKFEVKPEDTPVSHYHNARKRFIDNLTALIQSQLHKQLDEVEKIFDEWDIHHNSATPITLEAELTMKAQSNHRTQIRTNLSELRKKI